MNSRFHFSQKDNKNNLKEDESHYSTKDESVYNANVNNNKQSYHTFSPWEKYSYYYQPKVTIPFDDNRTNIYNFINNDKYDYYVNNPLINCNYNQNKRDINDNSIYLNSTLSNNIYKDEQPQNKKHNKSMNKKNNKGKKQDSNEIVFNSLEELVKELTKNNIPLINFITTEKGSREMQKLLYKLSPFDISSLIKELSSSMTIIMEDKYGNYFCQKLVQNCSPDQRVEILRNVKDSFNEVSCHSFGTYCLQVLVEISNMENEQALLSQCIENNLLSLACNQRGTHIVQKFFSSCSNEKFIQNIYTIVLSNFKELVNNPHGVCVLIRILKSNFCTKEKKLLIEKIIQNSLEIIQNPFGNYVVQSMLNEHFEKEKENCMKILDTINENFFSLSMQKFSSNVVENSLRLNSIEVLKQNLINVIVNGKINSMLKNTYGNFVIEKLIHRLSSQDKEEIKKIVESNGNGKSNSVILRLLVK